MTTGIYAVIDLLANEIIGGLHLHKHDAAAVRMFTDALIDPKTIIAKHPQDFNLLHLGYVTECSTICGAFDPTDEEIVGRIVLEGKQWLASQPKEENARP